MERLTERFDGWVVRKGCHGPCRTCDGAKCTDIYPMIDRLAAYEDTGPIERARELARAEKDGRLAMLPPNDPLALEELREMEGEPVWIVEYPDWGHWELSADAEDYVQDRREEFYGMNHDDPDGKFGLHLLGWLAYRRKPEEEAQIDGRG